MELSCELTCGKVVDQLRAHSSNLQHLGEIILFDVNRSLVINLVLFYVNSSLVINLVLFDVNSSLVIHLVAGVVYSSQCELSHRGQ